MQRLLQALVLVAALATAAPSNATIITGVDGPLAPASDYTLPYRADGLFDFSLIDIGPGITLRFDAGMTDVTLFALGDINIGGIVDGTGLSSLTLETMGAANLTGSITVGSLNVVAGSSSAGSWIPSAGVTLCSSFCGSSNYGILNGGQLVLPILPVINPNPIIRVIGVVPEPGTLWLFTALLPAFAMRARRR